MNIFRGGEGGGGKREKIDIRWRLQTPNPPPPFGYDLGIRNGSGCIKPLTQLGLINEYDKSFYLNICIFKVIIIIENILEYNGKFWGNKLI